MKLSLLRVAVLTLGVWCCSTVAAQAQSKDAAQFFPDNTQMVFSFNVKSLLNSSIFQKHFKEDLDKKLKENEQAQKILESMSFDPLRDLHSVSVTLNKIDIPFPGTGARPDVDLFVVAKGNFVADKWNSALGSLIAAANQGDRVSTSKYGDYTLFEAKDNSSGKSFYGTIFDKETIFLGNVKDQVTEAIERGLGKKAGSLNNKFADLMGKARNEATFWGALLIPSSVKDMAKMSPNAEAGDVMQKLESQTLKLDIKDNVKFDLSMFLTDAAAATKLKELADQARELAGMAALNNDQFGSELADIVSSVQVASNGNKVSVSGELKPDLVDKLIKTIKDRNK